MKWHFLNAEFDCSVDAMDRLLHSPSSELVVSLNEDNNVTGYNSTAWVEGKRTVTFTFPKSAMGPAAPGACTDRYVVARPGEFYAVLSPCARNVSVT